MARESRRGGEKRPLHPAAEAGEKNDERAEKERHQDGKWLGFATDAMPSTLARRIPTGMQQAEARVSGASGDADRELADTACRAEEREHRKAILEAGVDLFPGEEADENPSNTSPKAGEDIPRNASVRHHRAFFSNVVLSQDLQEDSSGTLTRTLSLALFRPPTREPVAIAERGLRGGPLCDKLGAPPAGMGGGVELTKGGIRGCGDGDHQERVPDRAPRKRQDLDSRRYDRAGFGTRAPRRAASSTTPRRRPSGA